MFQNNLKIALRNLRRHKVFTALNVAGLAVGLLCCMLIVLFLRFEKSMDGFHTNAGRIYKLLVTVKMNDGDLKLATAPPALVPAIKAELAGVEDFTRIYTPGETMVKVGEKAFFEENIFLADTSFFKIFSFPLLKGDPKTALRQPDGLVISERMAKKYFGQNEAIGQTLVLQNTNPFRVSGVMANTPENSTLTFDFVMPWSSLAIWEGSPGEWSWASPTGFVLLAENTAPATVEAQLPALMKRHVDEQLAARWTNNLQPLKEVYFGSEGWLGGDFGKMGNRRYSTIFSFLAFIVLGIACINFINLSTARAQERAKEVGVRKTLGALRSELMRQFLTEGMLTAMLAFVLALALMQVVLPFASGIFGNELTVNFLQDKGLFFTWLGIALLTGFFAGSYPAFVLSGFKPVEVLKSVDKQKTSGIWLRKGLVVAQFAASALLIIGTIVISRQLSFLQNKNLGFDKEQVVCLPLRTPDLQSKTHLLTNTFRNLPEAVGVTACDNLFDNNGSSSTYKVEGVDGGFQVVQYTVAPNWLKTMNIPLLAGRQFRPDSPADTSESVIVNEAAVRQFGWQTPENAIGKKVYANDDTLNVVGVTAPFHFTSLHGEIEPIVVYCNPGNLHNLLVRVRPGNLATTVASLESAWKQALPAQPFEHEWLDEHLNSLYETEQKVSKLALTGAGLAIFVACLGLFGLAVFTAQQRRKEIGIRKVLGASVAGIVGLLSKEVLALVLVALVIASPLAYFFMERWLQDFAYRIDIHWSVFALAGIVAVAVAFLTVSFQSVKAALANPVKSLRSE